jgi:acyl-CoA synthetase (AMP-forming)/AMP-acid ligase II
MSGTEAQPNRHQNGDGPPLAATSLAELVSSAAVRDPAGVALAIGRCKLTIAELEQFIAERLAGWKRPRLWRVVDEIPRTALGKVQRDVVVGFWANGSGADTES